MTKPCPECINSCSHCRNDHSKPYKEPKSDFEKFCYTLPEFMQGNAVWMPELKRCWEEAQRCK